MVLVDFDVGNERLMVMVAGPCVIESQEPERAEWLANAKVLWQEGGLLRGDTSS